MSERRLRDVLENVQLIAVSLDLDGRITFANQYFADLTGWTREELIGRVWLERFPSGDPQFVDRVRPTQILVHDEMPLVTRPATCARSLWSNTLDRDADGASRRPASARTSPSETAAPARRRRCGGSRRWSRCEAPAGEIFHAVTEEVAQLLGGADPNLVRFDEPPPGTVVAGWSEAGRDPCRSASGSTFDGPTAVPTCAAPAEAARVDDYTDIEGELAERLRALGLRSSVAAPVTVDGRVWGAITVSTIGDATLAPDAEARIGQFTELVAVCLSTAEARSQLAASRARIVAAGDAERRRLERNLHDGAQQRLVSLCSALRMARRRSRTIPMPAALLDSACEELFEALAELRELARGIHPAVLTDRGLRAARRRARPAVRPCRSRSRSTCPASCRRQVEAAAYYVVAEALTNVAKYAQATAAEVTIARARDGAIRVEVPDDGVGGADPEAGSGLRGPHRPGRGARRDAAGR